MKTKALACVYKTSFPHLGYDFEFKSIKPWSVVEIKTEQVKVEQGNVERLLSLNSNGKDILIESNDHLCDETLILNHSYFKGEDIYTIELYERNNGEYTQEIIIVPFDDSNFEEKKKILMAILSHYNQPNDITESKVFRHNLNEM